jgi:tRNA G26 N,N-dimethylase Trm1
MSKELLLQQQKQINALQNKKQEEEQKVKQFLQGIEQEIECPLCYGIMALCSNFDKFCYFYQECNLSLLIN